MAISIRISTHVGVCRQLYCLIHLDGVKESVLQFAIKMPGVDSHIGVLASIDHDEAM